MGINPYYLSCILYKGLCLRIYNCLWLYKFIKSSKYGYIRSCRFIQPIFSTVIRFNDISQVNPQIYLRLLRICVKYRNTMMPTIAQINSPLHENCESLLEKISMYIVEESQINFQYLKRR